jgi:hypothetical protein
MQSLEKGLISAIDIRIPGIVYIYHYKSKRMRTSALITLCLFIVLSAFSQTHVVKGKITAFKQYPVQNIKVASKKAKTAVMSDSLGQFELVCKEKDVIMIDSKVFDSFSERVTAENDFVSVNLIYRDSKKNRELATSMGYLKPDQLSYALAHLAYENNNFCNYADVFSLLRANFPEVQIISGAGGASKGVSIRGQKSINLSSEAVYEVDKMIVTDISFVNPCDIATIDIMKSGQTAVYGTQAINGVLKIQTKGYWTQKQNQ